LQKKVGSGSGGWSPLLQGSSFTSDYCYKGFVN